MPRTIRLSILTIFCLVFVSACSGSNLITVPSGGWKFALLAFRNTELPQGTAILRDPYAVERAAQILSSWVPNAQFTAYNNAGTITRVSWYSSPQCKTPYAVLGPNDAPKPLGYYGYVGLWRAPESVATCASGWAWSSLHWAQVYEYPMSDPTEGIIHELAHLVEWYAMQLGYNVIGVDNAQKAGYTCEPTASGCTWMRFLHDYYTGRFDGAIPQEFWVGGNRPR